MSSISEKRRFGRTDLEVTRLGVGAFELGHFHSASEVQLAGSVLGHALDLGINFIDTAGCYGTSEELIGAAVGGRRSEFVIASKTGHMSEGCDGDSWEYDCVSKSIDRSLKRLRTDRIDLMQLHSCDVATLERGEAIRALVDARDAGKVRYLGYSGDNDAVLWAARSGHFDAIQTSFNLVDQRPRFALFEEIRTRGLGLIAKRPILNGIWRTSKDPDLYGFGYTSDYFERQRLLTASEDGDELLPGEPDDRILASLGFTLAHDEVTVAIVGTQNANHLESNIRMLASLPLPEEFVRTSHERFDALGGEWEQKG